MKKIILVLGLILIATPAFSAWFIVNQDNKILAITQYQPDAKDLDSRKEIAIYSNAEINIDEAEYRNGKIIKHVLTQAELKQKDDETQKQAEQQLIDAKQKKMAYEQLKKDGVVFKQVKDADFQQ